MHLSSCTPATFLTSLFYCCFNDLSVQKFRLRFYKERCCNSWEMWLPGGQFSSTSADMNVCLSSDTHHSWAGTHGLREKCWCLLFTRNHNGALRLSPPTFEEALFWHSYLLSHSFRHHAELVSICKGGIKESATSLSLSPPLPSLGAVSFILLTFLS